jgi:hypothetical protein
LLYKIFYDFPPVAEIEKTHSVREAKKNYNNKNMEQLFVHVPLFSKQIVKLKFI